ncbi:MAG TPA: GIY-YIG nuclease family protein [Candidatus Paceibacterota bacterium]|nr:GIY-YIG nuclease family protein [Candidatus Paceibacterota bacterium]
METGYIYVIINRINGKFYFGKTFDIKKRWYKHLHNAKKKINRKLYDSINFHGIENFSIHQIGVYQTNNKKELTKILNEREKYFINLSNSINDGYNLASGGDGGYLGEEAIFKAANKKRGIPLSEEHKKNISEGNKGISKPLTQKTKNKIKNTCLERGIKPPAQFWGKPGYNDHPMLNKHHTKKTKDQMRKWREGKTYEEIYGKEEAERLKKEKSQRWIGNKINFKDIDLNIAEKLLKEGKNFKEIAKILNISLTAFNYKFREKHNITPYQYSLTILKNKKL